MKTNRWLARGLFTGLAVGLLFCVAGSTSQAAKSKEKILKLGTSYSVTKMGATYSSSDQGIAYVNKDGLVTAKKQGEVVIDIKKGKTHTRQTVLVVPNGKKKQGVDVSTGEISLEKNGIQYALLKVEQQAENTTGVENNSAKDTKYRYSATLKIRNQGTKNAKKVVIVGLIGGKRATFNFGKVSAGKTATITLTGEISAGRVKALAKAEQSGALLDTYSESISLLRLRVYSKEMYTSFDYQKKSTSYQWGTEDKTAPVVTGFTGKNSYNQKMPYQVVYSDDNDYDFFRYVKAEDDREGKVSLTVNTKKVNFKKAGTYQVTYVATDKAGNTAKAKARIEVRKAKQVDEMADEVLSEIIKDKWSVKRKAIAIYNYTRNHISYVGTSNKKNWEKEAMEGFRYGKGDCFTYYAVARILLTRAGIPNIEVTRYKGKGHHWWNMIYVEGAWYHYDCGPRSGGGRFCMLTDQQLTQYSRTHGNKYIWNYKKIPKSGKKKLSKVF